MQPCLRSSLAQRLGALHLGCKGRLWSLPVGGAGRMMQGVQSSQPSLSLNRKGGSMYQQARGESVSWFFVHAAGSRCSCRGLALVSEKLRLQDHTI